MFIFGSTRISVSDRSAFGIWLSIWHLGFCIMRPGCDLLRLILIPSAVGPHSWNYGTQIRTLFFVSSNKNVKRKIFSVLKKTCHGEHPGSRRSLQPCRANVQLYKICNFFEISSLFSLNIFTSLDPRAQPTLDLTQIHSLFQYQIIYKFTWILILFSLCSLSLRAVRNCGHFQRQPSRSQHHEEEFWLCQL